MADLIVVAEWRLAGRAGLGGCAIEPLSKHFVTNRNDKEAHRPLCRNEGWMDSRAEWVRATRFLSLTYTTLGREDKCNESTHSPLRCAPDSAHREQLFTVPKGSFTRCHLISPAQAFTYANTTHSGCIIQYLHSCLTFYLGKLKSSLFASACFVCNQTTRIGSMAEKHCDSKKNLMF